MTRKSKSAGPRGKVGQPTKLDEERAKQIVALVRGGNYLETAAAAAGVSVRSVRDWMRRGARDDSGPFFDFSEAVARAQGESEAADVLAIRSAGRKDWRATAFRLERRFPERWRETKRLEQTGADGGPVQTEQVRGLIRVPMSKLRPGSE